MVALDKSCDAVCLGGDLDEVASVRGGASLVRCEEAKPLWLGPGEIRHHGHSTSRTCKTSEAQQHSDWLVHLPKHLLQSKA